jgi:hypothetical protein
MSGPVGTRNEDAWERAWRDRYERVTTTTGAARGATGSRQSTRPRTPLRYLLLATGLLATTVTAVAIADTDERKRRTGDARVTAARGEGDAIGLGERNPASGESTRETAIVANAGSGGLVLRPSNTAKGGRAVSATCDNDGQAAEDGCAVYVNKGTGAAASFRTQGSVPFAIRDTNTGRVDHLNADMVDGRHATEFLSRGDAASFLGASAKAVDADAVDGRDSSAFLDASGKAADADKLDGKDSAEFLGTTAKAADADSLDGKDSLNFTRLGGAVFTDGDPAGIGFTSTETSTGVYRVEFPAGTFKTATSCKPPVPIVVPHSDTAVIATVAIGMATCSSVDGSGGFTARTFTHAGAATSSAFWFMVM